MRASAAAGWIARSACALAALALLTSLSALAEEPELKTSLAVLGKDSFRLYCRSCHGAEGKGDGTVAPYLKIPPADLTLLSATNGGEFPWQEVTEAVDGRKAVRTHGSKDMPIWGDALQQVVEDEDVELAVGRKIEEIVHYLRSIQAAGGS